MKRKNGNLSGTIVGLTFFMFFLSINFVYAENDFSWEYSGTNRSAVCYDYDVFEDADLFLGQCPRQKTNSWQFGGWIAAGITVNDHGCTNSYDPNVQNGPASRGLDALSGNSYLLMTEQPTDLKLNQAWLFLNKQIDTQHGFDWGFRMDTSFGTDSKFGQCFRDQSFDYDWGSGDYNLAIFQLYAELGYKDLKLRVGKFGSTMPYETICAPHNFFYSHSYSAYNTPLTFSGAILEYTLSKQLSVSAGWTAGYSNSLENRFGDNGFLGSIAYRPTDRIGLTYNLYFGRSNGLNKRADADLFGRPYDTEDNITQTLIFSWALTPRWTFVNEVLWVQNDYGNITNPFGNQPSAISRSYGTQQQLHYRINSQWAVGMRFEYLYCKGTIFDPTWEGADLYELSWVANWTPNKHLHIEPELRFDWNDYKNGFKPFDQGRESAQLTAGCAAIIKF